MGFTRDELEDAFAHYQRQVAKAAETGDWNHFAELFTEDADYDEHAFGVLKGREQIRRWVIGTMTSFPGNAMVSFPPAWYVLDPERGWIVCDVRNLMRDPGDGSVHEASNYTRLVYAGEGLFSFEEDVYNPVRFQQMAVRWARVADDHGTLPADARPFLDRFAPGWNQQPR
jgi:hypothetical protein